MAMEGAQAAGHVQSGSELNPNSDPKDIQGNGKGKEGTMTAKPRPPNLHLPSSLQRKASTSPHSTTRSRSRSRTSSRSPARSTHSNCAPNEKDRTPKEVKQLAEGTHRLVEYVDEDGISHWYHARGEHVNVHTECGRHGDEWLFGGWSLMAVWKRLMGRR